MRCLERVGDWLQGRSRKDEQVEAVIAKDEENRREQDRLLNEITSHSDGIARAVVELQKAMRGENR